MALGFLHASSLKDCFTVSLGILQEIMQVIADLDEKLLKKR